MNSRPSYRGYRFPPEIISHAVWLYHRFTLSLRDIEDLLAERNVIVSYESIRQWCATFGLDYARRVRKRRGAGGDCWFLDEMTVSIQGKRKYLWRAVDQDGDVLDILVQSRKDKRAAKRFFRKLLKGQGRTPLEMTTDKLRSYAAAKREIMPSVGHCQYKYATTEQKYRTNILGSKNVKCAGLHHRVKHSGFSASMDRYTISFALDVIC